MKNFSCTYSLFKVSHSIKSKIIECGIIFLHKYKLEHTEVISRLLSSLFYHKLQELLVKYNMHIFLTIFIQLRHHEFRKYSSNHNFVEG